MKTINYEDVRFFQNPDERKTIALYEGCGVDAYSDFIRVTNEASVEGFITVDMIPEELFIPNTIRAISTCHDQDQWDPEIGKKQAYFKLLRSYNKMKNRAISRMIKKLNNQIKATDKLSNYYDTSITRYNKLVRYPKGNIDGITRSKSDE